MPETISAPKTAQPAAKLFSAAAGPALPDSVQWIEGMLLSPQHFQQSDVYWQEQLRYRLSCVAPDFWGLSLLQLDMVKLKAGIVAIKRLECIMPDGTPVVFPGSYTGKALELDVTAQLQRTPDGVRLSLIMPVRGNASNHWNTTPARNEVVHGLVSLDENTLTGSVPVDRLRPAISLSAEVAAPAGYEVCPLFELFRREENRHVEFKPYHPPMLCWQAGDFLKATGLRHRLQLLNEALWLKLRELGTNREGDGPEDDELQGAHFRKHLDMARRLAAVLPQFSLIVQRPESSPRAVYDSLALLLGTMASFGANPIPPVLDAYQHDDCSPQFRRALDYVVRKLSYINTSFELQPFERHADGTFTHVLPPDAGEQVLVELRPQGGQGLGADGRASMERWLLDACIASEALLPAATRLRVTARPHLLTAEELAKRNLRSGAALFAIDNQVLQLKEGETRLFGPGQNLVISGDRKSPGTAPAMILLYRARAAGTRT
ncbi:type VI secretion system baseplate subunit TssK [Polaromonas aquatica]|uniref:type VI secretion system baseplate subunit TssK n=1 Tax=Polaromonas aquatica TaxID=332657 RepID=UPI003D648540